MTAQEIQQRNERSQQLRVLQTDDGNTFFVESSDAKIAYRVEGTMVIIHALVATTRGV